MLVAVPQPHQGMVKASQYGQHYVAPCLVHQSVPLIFHTIISYVYSYRFIPLWLVRIPTLILRPNMPRYCHEGYGVPVVV